MSERDYPKGHPAASDYNGEPYTPPLAPFSRDFDKSHPAHGGRNTGKLDTPDGMREHVLMQHLDNEERTAKANKHTAEVRTTTENREQK